MLSRLAYTVCAVVILYISLFYLPKWKAGAGTESSFGWDASTYYWYLPATFIYRDLKEQKFGDSIIARYGFTPSFSQSFVHSSGNRVITYSSGVALLCLPAFAAAHVVAEPMGYQADGFSKPYQAAVQVWAVLAGLVGLWYFRKLLRLYFRDKIVAILLLMLVLGTNYLNYAAYDATITHSYLFTIYVLLLLNTHHFYIDPQRRYAIRIGLLAGLAVLVRPSEMIVLVIPLLWGMESLSRSAVYERMSFLKKNRRYILSAVAAGLIVCSVQVIYWLYVAGRPLVYSYDDKTFSWLSPHTWKYLTSYDSGWILYSPMALFIVTGIVPFVKYGRNRVAILTFFILNLYVVSAWDIWWYSGIGGRAMVQSYAVIFFIAGTCIESVMGKKLLRCIVVPIMLLFMYLNLWFFYQAHAADSLYNPVHMSKRYYWRVLGKWKVNKEVLKLQDARNIYTGPICDKQLLYQDDFQKTATGELSVLAGKNSARFTINYAKSGREWIRVEATYKCSSPEYDEWKMMRTRFHFINGEKEVMGEDWKPQRFLRNDDAVHIHYDIVVPKQDFDKLQVSFLNETGRYDIAVDDLLISSYNSCR
ncbi:MAG TPA: hypothetical protein VEB40_14790 [Flavipsychrobacter sp.]|nr:hypothetical protein [Flavipsychrobacter sp.]